MSIQLNLNSVRKKIPEKVQLVCVSKYNPNKAILEAYNCGERIFGESKVQEMCEKFETLPKDIEWHFIGHLQSNKIKYIVPFVSLIHGIDSMKLLNELNKQASKINVNVKCLLQIHIAEEETKFGFSSIELIEELEKEEWKSFKNITISGLMGMATFTNNKLQVQSEFNSLKTLYDTVKNRFFLNDASFKEISMGMSDDFQLAIEAGSTMVRIGSSIFGQRNYSN